MECIIKIDSAALFRAVLKSPSPAPATVAAVAELGGAEGICVNLREKRFPLESREVRLLRETIQPRLILQTTATTENIGLALDIRTDRVVFVDEEDAEKVTVSNNLVEITIESGPWGTVRWTIKEKILNGSSMATLFS